MTKLEAWIAWSLATGTEALATEFTLENSSHGKAFSFAWDAATEMCAQLAENYAIDREDEYVCGKVADAIRETGSQENKHYRN